VFCIEVQIANISVKMHFMCVSGDMTHLKCRISELGFYSCSTLAFWQHALH